MPSSLKRLSAIAGLTCAIAGVGPVAFAGADTSSAPVGNDIAFPSLNLPSLPNLPNLPTLPNLPDLSSLTNLFQPPQQSCSVNQGLFPGIINLGPTGPLGPLGPHGPFGNNNNLPCGSNVFNLGPSGPLGPGGPLGGSQ